MLVAAFLLPMSLSAQSPSKAVSSDSIATASIAALKTATDSISHTTDSTLLPLAQDDELGLGILLPDNGVVAPGKGVPVDGPELVITAPDSLAESRRWENQSGVFKFNPDPTRAVWLAALCPGLGQIYNRRYWKLPLIVGGFMGLGYGASWNNSMLRDYTRAYADLLDNDPSSRSYMNLYAPGTDESKIDKAWLKSVIKARRNMYRRQRDYCIIGIVGVYLASVIDAYVDASLSHFDISPDLSMDVGPAVMPQNSGKLPSLGVLWAFNF